MDGISWDVVLQLSQGADQPALAVILNGSPAVIAARLAEAGWPVRTIDITTRSADQAAMIVTDRILALHADANPEQP
jgi:hypothetical protein